MCFPRKNENVKILFYLYFIYLEHDRAVASYAAHAEGVWGIVAFDNIS